MGTMKAVRIHSYGGPEVLTYEDADVPQPAPDEVMIRVQATTVNPIDWKVRAGYVTGWFNLAMPAILGCDVSGTVEAVGSDVTSFAPGDEVYGRADITGSGTYAEYVSVQADHVALKPRTLDHVSAAAVPHVALAAWQCLFDAGNLAPGQTVLIHGAAGGVGTFAVQLAKWRGARVIGTASAHHHAAVRALGADEVIDYTTTRFEDVVHNVDLVLDTIGGETLQRSWATLKPAGMLVTLVETPSEELAAAHGVRARLVGAEAKGETLAKIAELIDAGSITPVISAIFPLREVHEAHMLSQSLHVHGKIVLRVTD